MFQVWVKRLWLSAQRLLLLQELLGCHIVLLIRFRGQCKIVLSSRIETLAVGIQL